MDEESIKKYDFFISKIMYNLIALIGFLIIFMTGMFYGYTFHQNEQYFNTDVKEIRFIEYINQKYTYNFIPNKELKYSDELAKRILTVTYIFIFIGVLLLEIGYKFNNKYKYNKSLSLRLKEFYEKIKKG